MALNKLYHSGSNGSTAELDAKTSTSFAMAVAQSLGVSDVAILSTVILTAYYFLFNGSLSKLPFWSSPTSKSPASTTAQEQNSRSIVELVHNTSKNCVVFYGSQTGTAENYARRLAKEAKSRYGLNVQLADLEDYDYDDLAELPENVTLMFLLSTSGEGDPTDNAVEFYNYVTGGDGGDGPSEDFANIRYVAFGLGNSTYEHYNAVVRCVSAALDKLGAQNLSRTGEGDDATGTTEEDFVAWKQDMWQDLVNKLGLQEREMTFEATFEIKGNETLDLTSPQVFVGEPNAQHLSDTSPNHQFSSTNPFIASVSESRELFNVKDRNCLHFEVDLGNSGLSYETGDHIAVWPTNSEGEVERLLKILGLEGKQDDVITISGRDSTSKVPIPSPTTYGAALRHYLEIAAPVSREFISTIAAFAPNGEAKAEAIKLGQDKTYFHDVVSKNQYTIGRVLQRLSNFEPWLALPFSAIVEGVGKLQPRYYSISSSSLVQPNAVSITAVVETSQPAGETEKFRGVATNYLLALKHAHNREADLSVQLPKYSISGPRGKYEGIKMPVHLRKSNFKLPKDHQRPIILIGPGTGVAPFRGFIHERAALAKSNEKIGKTLLFFGCRKQNEDFIYQEEWKELKQVLGDQFDIKVAFSREGVEKVYVQHLMRRHGDEVLDLIRNGAYIYVCGDARTMARDVNSTLVDLLARQDNKTPEEAEEALSKMRSLNLYQEDVW